VSVNSEYRYSGSAPSNGSTGAALSAIVAACVSQLTSVRTVCDLGCGNGYLSGLLLEKGYSVVGVDASRSGTEIARRMYGSRAQFHCARIDAEFPASLEVGRFDCVVSSDVVEHLYRPKDLIDCAQSLLVPGGWLVIGTPYHGYLKNLALSVLDRWDAHHTVDWDGGHIKFFSVRTLTKLVSDGGFRVERFHYFGRVPWFWMNMICTARKL
jgi:2-polyprenyl-6-hydroxyphenyl methylase/3-demethylubiquinone-9 3-methyltransferase